MIITYIYSNRSEDQIRAQFRCRNLAEAINRTGTHRAHLLELKAFIHNTPEALEVCAQSDLLVIFRYLYGDILAAIEYWQARDKKIMIDFDQAVQFLTPARPDYAFWLAGEPLAADLPVTRITPPPLEQFKWGLGLVDAATVVSSRLADDWAQATSVYELPDYLNTDQYPVLGQGHGNEIWLGLGQSLGLVELRASGLAEALPRVLRAVPQARLVWSDPETAPAAALGLDPAQVSLQTPRSFDEWVSLLLQYDLGLAPSAGDYALRLGPVHLLEFMIAKIPWVASEQSAFRHLAQYGRWVQNSAQAWETALLEAIHHLAAYRKKAAREPFLFALGQDVGANLDKALKIYSTVLSQEPG